MHDRPDPADLLDAVAELLLSTILPDLDNANAYQARIAASLVRLVARQLRTGDEDIDVTDLADRIRSGAATLEGGEVAAQLWRVTRAKLAVDQPNHPRLSP